MSGLCDLHDYDLTDAERLALCFELERLNRNLSPSYPAARGGQFLPFETPSPAGEDITEVTV